MKYQKPNSNRRLARGLRSAASALLFAVVSVPMSFAQTTFPLSGTARFESGVQRLATVDMNRSAGAMVDWGDGTSAQPGLLKCEVVGTSCDIFGTHRYVNQGSYTITISYTSPGPLGSGHTAQTMATVSPVGDFVVLSIGDSVASGEGNPVVPFGGPLQAMATAYWDDPGSDYTYPSGDPDAGACHRSSEAGPALAATTIGSTNPVTFVHVACSGDDVSQTISQLRSARGRLPRIDVLLISVGANEIQGSFGSGFGALVAYCITTPCSQDPQFAADLNTSISSLGGKYDNLDESIHCVRPEDGMPDNCSNAAVQIPGLVLITEYFDPTHNENGSFPTPAESLACTGLTIDTAEWEFLYDHVVVPLNQQVHASPWNAVGGIASAFLEHGYCASGGENWVVTVPESLIAQADQNGSGHPNANGHQVYADMIYTDVVDLNPPVTTASATADGSPYTFGTWTGKDVEVTLSAVNPIQESGVGDTYYAVDDPACEPSNTTSCLIYTAPFTLDSTGQHVVSFFSDNAGNGRETVKTAAVWIDKDPPVLTCSASPSLLWPPNGKLVKVRTSVEAVDAIFGVVPFTLTSITASEGDVAAGVRKFDIGSPDVEGKMRAQRSGSGPGRVYGLVYEAADDVGNVGSCLIEVTVPHDMRNLRGSLAPGRNRSVDSDPEPEPSPKAIPQPAPTRQVVPAVNKSRFLAAMQKAKRETLWWRLGTQ